MSSLTIRPNWNNPGTPFRHTWEGMINVDQFRWMVRADMQDQLRMAHAELGARHVRAVGMFDDEMRVLTPDPVLWKEEAKVREEPNWQIVTYIIERLLGIGINPVFTTCFMPGAMAAGNRTVFETKARISPPKDMAAWRKLVQHSVKHAISHFGREIVTNWYFEVWNEPNLRNGFFEGSQAEFFELYLATLSAIKEVDASLKVGGPSTARGEWLQEFLEFCRRNDSEPDYLITHIYNNDSEGFPLSPFDGLQADQSSKSPHFAAGVMRGTRKLLDALSFKGELHWNEWGRSWHPCEPDRETANEAAFIVKTMAEASQLGDYFGYWNLSDIYDQIGYGRTAFHGNYGLLNLQGLRKPAYHAFQLLSKLGHQRVEIEGEGLSRSVNAIATVSNDSADLLIYAYEEGSGYREGRVDVCIDLPQECGGIEICTVDARDNNIVTAWQEIGAPDYLNADVLRGLRKINSLSTIRSAPPVNGILRLSLGAPGISLVRVSKPHF